MFDGIDKVSTKPVDRRSFLRGSALFAAAIGVSVATSAFAQEPAPQQPQPEKPEEEKKDPPSQDNETKIDKDGREYRVCPQCASNMYRQGRTWTCENCGYSYVE
jgi:hypothetical protein